MAASKSKSNTHERGARAGRNAPPTPCKRLGWPESMKLRLQKAGIKTEVKNCK